MAENSRVPVAVKSGTITVLGVPLECSVLDNGQCIISEESMLKLMEVMESGEQLPNASTGMEEYARFMNQGILPNDDSTKG